MMSSFEANTTEDRIKDNKTLLNDLFYANKCLKVLSEIKAFIELLFEKYEKTFDSNDRHFCQKLVREAEEVLAKERKTEDRHLEGNEESDETIVDSDRLDFEFMAKSAVDSSALRRSANTNAQSMVRTEGQEVSEDKSSRSVRGKGLKQTTDRHTIRKMRANLLNKILDFKTRESTDGEQVVDKRFVCDVSGCQSSFATKRYLDNHMRGVHAEATIECPFDGCDRMFKTKDVLKSHLAYVHSVGDKPKPKAGSYKCTADDCHASFPSKSTLNKHIKKDHFRREYMCTVNGCDKATRSNEQLKRHLYRHHQQEEPQIRCKWVACDWVGTVVELRQHRLTHKAEIFAKYKYVCDFADCHFRTCERKSFISHTEKKHLTEKKPNYICNVCHQGFTSDDNLVLHAKAEHNIDKPFTCIYPGCDFETKFNKGLDRHIKNVHLPNYDRFTCPEQGCDKVFGKESNLKKHMSVVHYESDKYRCEWPGCEYKTGHMKNLSRHHLIHTKERNFVCDIQNCGQSFTLKYSLNMHKKSYHKLGPILACQWPGCEFTTRHPITYHSHVSHHKSRNQSTF